MYPTFVMRDVQVSIFYQKLLRMIMLFPNFTHSLSNHGTIQAIPFGVRPVLRETAGRGRGADNPAYGEQISPPVPLSERVHDGTLQKGRPAAYRRGLRLYRRAEYLYADGAQLQEQRRGQSLVLPEELYAVRAPQRVDREKPVPAL